MAEFSLETVLLISGVIMFAATLQGITGFGFNLLAVPALILVYPPQVVVPGVLMSYIPLGLTQVVQLRHLIDLRLLGTFLGSAFFALPFGAYILGQADAETMRTGIGAMMVLMVLLLQLRPGNPFKRDLLARIGTGFVSGALATSTGVSGPPLVLLGLKQGWPYANFRATLMAYFTCQSLLSLPFHLFYCRKWRHFYLITNWQSEISVRLLVSNLSEVKSTMRSCERRVCMSLTLFRY